MRVVLEIPAEFSTLLGAIVAGVLEHGIPGEGQSPLIDAEAHFLEYVADELKLARLLAGY